VLSPALRLRSTAALAGGTGFPVSSRTAADAAGPDMRKTQTPARPRADDNAKMVRVRVTA
jgi:hypothetical protein